MDDAFRRQLESLQASHQTELLRLANDKQKQIEQSNQKVAYANGYHSHYTDLLSRILRNE